MKIQVWSANRIGWFGSIGRGPMLLLALLAAMLLSGCMYTAAPADLLQKPTIAAEQEELITAIKKALPQFSVLMLPHKDDYKEAIRFVDVNGDGSDEALVTFYNEYSVPEMMLLKNTEYGWRQSVKMEHALARDIAWLKLIDLDGDGEEELLTGWIGAFDSPNVLDIYSFKSKAVRNEKGRLSLQPIQSLAYSLAEAEDIDGDGKAELVVIDSMGTSGELELPSYFISVYSWKIDSLERRQNFSLPTGVHSFDRILVGQVADRINGVVLEGNTGAHSMLTYMYAWVNHRLTLVYPNRSLGQEGLSARPTASDDMNDDGVIELQWSNPAPGYEHVPYFNMMWINEWVQWDGKHIFNRVSEQYIDYTYGVKFHIPEEWIGWYTMRKPSALSYGIVTFELWHEDSGPITELATLYVIPNKQWGNVESAWKEERRPYRMVASDSGNVYLVSFVDEVPERLTADEQEQFMKMRKIESSFANYLTIMHD